TPNRTYYYHIYFVDSSSKKGIIANKDILNVFSSASPYHDRSAAPTTHFHPHRAARSEQSETRNVHAHRAARSEQGETRGVQSHRAVGGDRHHRHPHR